VRAPERFLGTLAFRQVEMRADDAADDAVSPAHREAA
jgi:hypothetical protein